MGYLDDKGLSHLWNKVKAALSTKQPLLTGRSGQVVGFDGMGLAYAVQGWSNPNLLLNWDFRNPVNRNGNTEYVISNSFAYTIDRWKAFLGTVTISNGYVKFSSNKIANYKRLLGVIESSLKAGQAYTLSLFARVNDVSGNVRIRPTSVTGGGIPEAVGAIISGATDDFELLTYTFTLMNNADKIGVEVLCLNAASDYIDIDIAAWKLELCGHQTLARQNEDGEWEIIDPPNYDLQYALCGQYSPSTGEWVGSQHSNPDLLDNGYFLDPINQRGQTEYTGSGYTIDRWRTHTTHAVLTVRDHGIRLGVKNAFSSEAAIFGQSIENPKYLTGQQVTLSLLAGEINSNGVWSLILRGSNQGQYVGAFVLPALKTGFNRVTVSIPSTWNIDELSVRLNVAGSLSGDYIDLIAAKLELGGHQTLAHQDADGNWVLNDPPPDRALELAKCQRYQVAPIPYGAMRFVQCYYSGSVIQFIVPIPATLRDKPTLSGVEKLLIYNNLNNTIHTGFTFSVTNCGPGFVSVSATKENHGLTNAGLTILGHSENTINFLFDANL